MKILGYMVAAGLALLGLTVLFAAVHAEPVKRGLIGLMLLGAAGVLIYLVKMRPAPQTHVHKMELDLTGDVSLQQITCKQCGAELSSDSVEVAAGAVFVHCQYCGTQYQLEEEAKW